MSKEAYVGAIIADVHWGAFKAQLLYSEMKELTLDTLDKMAILDFVIIAGDFFDDKISMNSDHAKYSMEYLSRLLDICKKKNAKLRIVKGTESHDNRQLEIFGILNKKDEYDFKVVETVSTEWMFDDFHVLYIPEEYIVDKEEYYKDYLDKEYDMIFGHGLVNEVMFVATKQESEATMAKAPVFKSEELLKICKGPIFFGHIHIPQIIKERFFYVGSSSRWCFGEEQDKGFYLVTYETDTNQFITEFKVNKKARRYDTVVIDYKSPLFEDKHQNQLEFLMNLAQTLVIDYLRLEINIPEDYPNPALLTHTINEAFLKYSNIKTKIINNNKARKEKETEQKVNLLLEKYGFIFDNISHEEKISKFIKIKYNRNIPLDRLRQYLYNEITKGELQNGGKE